MSDYPEHDKLQAIHEQSQSIGEFIEWLGYEKGLHLGFYTNDYFDGEVLLQASYSTTKLLAEFFNIDLDALEKEKRKMVDELMESISDG